MISATDPHRRFQRRMALQAGICWGLGLLAALWAWRAPAALEETVAIARPAATAATPAPDRPINAAAWEVTLWRPFTDEAPPAATAAAPTAFRLYSILQQGDGLTAAIAPGDNAALVYVKAGDSGNGYTVLRVEADGVVLRINGQEQRLGLGP